MHKATAMFDNPGSFLKIALGAGFLAAGMGLGYYYGVYLPRLAERREAIFTTQKQESRTRFDSCLASAYSSYTSNWNDNCKSLKRKEGCALSIYVSNDVEKYRDKSIKLCLDMFKAGI